MPQDYRQAVYWLNEGIPGSDTPGHIPLNALYDKAHPADRVYSQKWYRKTAESVMAKVQYNFGVWYYNGYHLSKDHNLALEWYRKAAAQGLAEAQDAIGVMFMQDEGVSQDYQQALTWYRKAARQGLPAAQTHLGIMSAFGRGVVQSDRQAIAWYRKAAKHYFAKAQYQLGVAYSTGKGVPENSRNALKWYRKAAEQGFAPAQSALGEMYSHGRQGVPKDNKQAYIWYDMVSLYTRKSEDECLALRAERDRLKETLIPAQLDETYAAFDLIRRKIDQSEAAKNVARKKY